MGDGDGQEEHGGSGLSKISDGDYILAPAKNRGIAAVRQKSTGKQVLQARFK